MSQDYIALEWVKGEIENTLKQAQQALEGYVSNPEDKSSLKFCLSYLHQIHGTLIMVEFYGAALLAEEMEAVALALTEQQIEQERPALEILMQAIIQLPHYLEHIKVGRRDFPVVLLPILNELRSARGEAFLSESALFSPQITHNPELNDTQKSNISSPGFSQWARKVRQMLQAASLQLLQGKQPEVAKQYLSKAFARLDATLGSTPQGIVWLPALAFSEWLAAQQHLPNSARQLLRELDLLLKDTIEQGVEAVNRPASDELIKNLLFYVARTEVKSAAIRRAQEQFALIQALPESQETQQQQAQFAGPDKGTISTVLAALIDELGTLKDSFDLLVRNTDDSERLSALSSSASKIKQVSDTMGMLSLGMPRQVMQEQYSLVDAMLQQGEINDETLLDIAGALLYVEATLKGMQTEGSLHANLQESSLNDAQKAVLREARNTLEQVKDGVIAYIANHWAVAEIQEVPNLLASLKGSLEMIPLPKVTALLSLAAHFVEERLIAEGLQPEWAVMDTFADVLSGVEYYIERFSENRNDANDNLLNKAEQSLHSLTGIYASEFVATAASDNIEAEIEPAPEATPEAVPVAEVEEDDDDLIDEEIIEIFLEEAEEVTETLNEFWPQFKANNDDQEALTTVRRAFHTLKGSGRMVKANDLGELAWSIENMFNRVLDKTISLSDELVALVDHVIQQIPALIDDFRFRRPASINTQPLMDYAFELAAGKAVAPLSTLLADNLNEAPVETTTETTTETTEIAASSSVETENSQDDDEDDLDEALVDIFVSETNGHLETVNQFLQDSSREHYQNPVSDVLQRALHTLKGSAHMAGIGSVAQIANPLEKLVKGMRAYQLPNSEELTALLSKAEAIIQNGLDNQPSLYNETLEGSAELLAEITALGQKLSEEVAVEGYNHPNQQDLAHFMSHGMEALLDADSLLQQWQQNQDNSVLSALRHDLHLVAHDAAKANLPHIQVLAEVLDEFYQNIETHNIQADGELINIAAHAHEGLLSLLDCLAAGQETHRPEELLEELRSWDFSTAIDTPVAEVVSEEIILDIPSFDEDEQVDSELIEIFLEEAQEILEAAEHALEQWQENPEDLLQVTQLQRELHTLKGGARMADISAVADLCHELETLYEKINDGRLNFDHSLFNLLERAHDTLSIMLDKVHLGQSAPAANELLNELIHYQPTSADSADSADSAETPDADEADLVETEIAAESEPEPEPELEPHSEPQFETVTEAPLHSEALDEADREILEIFIEEANELNEDLERCLQQWQEAPDSNEQLDEALRLLHTLKGGARLSGLSDIGDLTHEFESDILKIQIGKNNADATFFTHAYKQFDQLISLVEQVQQTLQSGAYIALSEPTLVLDSGSQLESVVATEELTSTADSESESDAEASESSTNIVPLRPQEAKPSSAINPNTAAPVQQSQPPKAPQELVRVSADLLDNLVNLAGETSIGRGRLEQHVSDFTHTLEEVDMTLERLRDQLRRLDMETEAQVLFRQERQGPDYEDFDPLEMDRYSTIQQLSRALVESTSDLVDLQETLANKNRDAETLLLQQSRINSELQEGLMQTRMVPFQQMVPRLRRIVRQVSHELDKKVELHIHGASGEMDRSILERMTSPLEHMLRNAVDHGIETTQEREQTSKPSVGSISIEISRDGGDVLLTISDDGKGIDVENIRKKAIERGLMEPGSPLTQQEIMQFILQAGFSTAQAVTQISGRGVGMDVVSSEIKQMGGSIEIQSELGQGTRFVVRLPFTVSVNRALMIKMVEDLYAVPLNNIQGIVRIPVAQLRELYQKPVDERVYHYAGIDYRLEYLGALLDNLSTPEFMQQALPIPVLLVRGSQPYALQVDSLLGSREIVVKTLGPQFATVMGVSGGTILGDGSVVIILDLQALTRIHASLEYRQARELEKEESERRQRLEVRLPKIMVVDDSVTVRKVTTRLLERHGMEVITAKDGLDAITILQETIPDLMLLDIEMPRMDGFEVASQVRHSSRLKHLPIIMITSRTGDKHRERAMHIGVNEYMGKPFQEDILLANINRLLDTKEE